MASSVLPPQSRKACLARSGRKPASTNCATLLSSEVGAGGAGAGGLTGAAACCAALWDDNKRCAAPTSPLQCTNAPFAASGGNPSATNAATFLPDAILLVLLVSLPLLEPSISRRRAFSRSPFSCLSARLACSSVHPAASQRSCTAVADTAVEAVEPPVSKASKASSRLPCASFSASRACPSVKPASTISWTFCSFSVSEPEAIRASKAPSKSPPASASACRACTSVKPASTISRTLAASSPSRPASKSSEGRWLSASFPEKSSCSTSALSPYTGALPEDFCLARRGKMASKPQHRTKGMISNGATTS
mmetsp:Transcript_20853/g.48337  ORF Transcript_20853/g.48337 Transcript_20853/m.48337 type:complete len:308 (+) Transcript_20853:225-1148(+)